MPLQKFEVMYQKKPEKRRISVFSTETLRNLWIDWDVLCFSKHVGPKLQASVARPCRGFTLWMVVRRPGLRGCRRNSWGDGRSTCNERLWAEGMGLLGQIWHSMLSFQLAEIHSAVLVPWAETIAALLSETLIFAGLKSNLCLFFFQLFFGHLTHAPLIEVVAPKRLTPPTWRPGPRFSIFLGLNNCVWYGLRVEVPSFWFLCGFEGLGLRVYIGSCF